MVAFFCPPPFMRPAASSSPLVVTPGSFANGNNTSANTITHGPASIGVEGPDRWVIVFAIGNTGTSVTAMTIGGINATVFHNTPNAGQQGPFVIGMAKVPTGSTASIGVTYSPAVFSSAVFVGTIRASANIAVTGSNGILGTSGASRSLSLPIKANGGVLAMAYGSTSNSTVSPGAGTLSSISGTPFGASSSFTGGNTVTTTTTVVSNASATGLIAASFEPA